MNAPDHCAPTLPPPDTRQRWFTREVHVHESSLKAYLRGSFPTVRDVDDVVQESFLRVWKARAARPINSARAFLFKVARHVALDLVRRSQVSPLIEARDLDSLPVLDGGTGVAETASNQERIRLLADAIDSLPARCRSVVIMRKIECLPQREVADRLGLAEKTVEAHLARGVVRCEEYLRARGVRALFDHECR